MTAIFRRVSKSGVAIGSAIGAALLAGTLSGCVKSKGELVVDDSVGVTALRDPCPRVAIPEYAGDVTLFSDPKRTDSGALDVTASITNLRSTCDQGTEKLYTVATFDVLARRSDTRGARHVELPYFSSVMRGGNVVIAKRVGTVSIDFADGQDRATGHAKAASYVDRAQATLPEEIRNRLSRKRRAGDADAAIDPLAQPDVRAAIARATFELLVGFQLTDQQLTFNATR
ncbi:hypothetical protein [Novosphingobium sp. SCN 63-17]|uniref:hypothetical protein n=1 Tax=Novosphingobium sp. SCN 63-17 TaxID=1660120 RepID=UPI00086DDBFA|nr:hypothetical protein [Novosphingobium sp. SCN 63-17]ODU81617.1 MAG: hypothetical protein ABT10_13315 [Novosphingobium sp. SCN 63-17]